MHKIWEIVNKAWGWQGGTIHQIAKELGFDNPTWNYSSLLLKEGDICYYPATFLGKKVYTMCYFKEYTGIVKNKEGKPWLKCDLFAPGFASGGSMYGVDAKLIKMRVE